ncbi:MAG: hypothetical protein K6B41_03565 [Butyrivibrio sp.]|nr:hypothetical protein [Butyrivibrio sp.]
MNSKRLLAIALSTTMVLGSSLTVFAEDAATTGAQEAVAGTSSLTTQADKIKVTLPTSAIPLLIDTEGYINGTWSNDTLTEAGDPCIMSNAFVILNKSNIDVSVTADLKLTANAGDVTSTVTPTLVSTADGAVTGGLNDYKMKIYAVPAKTAITAIDATEAAYAASTTGWLLSAESITPEFAFNKATYTITRTASETEIGGYTYAQGTDPTAITGTGMQIKGTLNPNADWGAFKASYNTATPITFTYKYTIAKADGEEEVSEDIPYYVTPETALASVTVAPSQASATVTSGTAVTLATLSGAGKTGITSIVINDSIIGATRYTLASTTGVITLDTTFVTNWYSTIADAGSVTGTITYSDSTTETFTLTAASGD